MAVGWGRSTWGDGPWGEPAATLVPVSGQSATSALGIVSVIADSNITLVGQEATAAVNGVGVNAQAVAVVPSLDSQLGTVSVQIQAEANVTPTGQEATSALGTAVVDAEANVSVDGLELTSALGTLTSVTGEANVTPPGQVGTSSLGAAAVDAKANVSLTGFGLTSVLGTVTTIAKANAAPTGLSASATLPPETNEWTANNGAAISTAQSKFGGASLLLDGVNDNVISNTVYDFQSNAFTIEFWARPANATQDEVLLDTRDSTSNTSIYFRQAGTTLLIGRGTVTLLTVNNVFSANTWVSLAVTRGNPFTNTYTVFVDGNNEGDILLGAFPTASDIHIGSDFNNTNNWSGYIDEIRLSNVDRYGGTSYTPATSEFSLDANTLSLLHLDGINGSTSIIDEVVNEPLVVTGIANIFPTGLEGTSALGSVAILLSINIDVTGQSATSALGNVTQNADANVILTGVSATGNVGKVLVWSLIDENQTPNYTNITDTQTSSFSEIDEAQAPSWEEVA